jgi:hypothetical protein
MWCSSRKICHPVTVVSHYLFGDDSCAYLFGECCSYKSEQHVEIDQANLNEAMQVHLRRKQQLDDRVCDDSSVNYRGESWLLVDDIYDASINYFSIRENYLSSPLHLHCSQSFSRWVDTRWTNWHWRCGRLVPLDASFPREFHTPSFNVIHCRPSHTSCCAASSTYQDRRFPFSKILLACPPTNNVKWHSSYTWWQSLVMHPPYLYRLMISIVEIYKYSMYS